MNKLTRRQIAGLVIAVLIALFALFGGNTETDPPTDCDNPDTICITTTPAPTTEASATPETPDAGTDTPPIVITVTPTTLPTDTPSPTVDPKSTPTQIAPGTIPNDAPNLLRNPGFESGESYYPGEYLNEGTVEIPDDWQILVCHPPYTPEKCPAAKAGDNPDSLLLGLPETHLIRLDPNEPELVHSGEYGFKGFEFYRAGRFGLQQVADVQVGWLYEFSGWFRVYSAAGPYGCWGWLPDLSGMLCDEGRSDSLTTDDQQNVTITLRFNVVGDEFMFSESTVSTSFNAYSFGCFDQWCYLSAQQYAQTDKLTVSWECDQLFPLNHNDCYADDFSLRGIAPESE